MTRYIKLFGQKGFDMQNKNKSVVYTGPSFLGFLALIFILLKLCDIITWSWWWVLAPLWGPWVFALALVLFLAAFFPAIYSRL